MRIKRTGKKFVKKQAPKNQTLNKDERKEVKKMIQGSAEKKFRSILINGQDMLVGAQINKLNFDGTNGVPQQGTGDNDRIGDDINWVSLHMDLFVHNGESANFGNYGRFIIFQWHQNDNVGPPSLGVPTPTAILLPGILGVPEYDSQYQQDTGQLFTILYDKIFCVSADGSNSYQHVGKFIKIKRTRARFLTGGVANPGTNQLYYMILGDGVGPETATMFATFY